MPYSTRADVEVAYGATELTLWADLDGDGVSGDIEARIISAIVKADNRIDDALRGGKLVVPFSPVPSKINELSAMLAGVIAYEARGVKDFDAETGKAHDRMQYKRRYVEGELAAIKIGSITLDVPTAKRVGRSFPAVVTIEDDYVS